MSHHDITLTVNGTDHDLTVESRALLAHVLRDELGYTGTNVGCESSRCGACTVAVDGDAVKSCTTLAVRADGADIETVEGLDDGDDLHPLQTAFHEAHGLQCGYCTPGMLLTAREIIEETTDPTREQIREQLQGNLCRCTGYQNIVTAVQHAAETMAESDGEGETEDAVTDGGCPVPDCCGADAGGDE